MDGTVDLPDPADVPWDSLAEGPEFEDDLLFVGDPEPLEYKKPTSVHELLKANPLGCVSVSVTQGCITGGPPMRVFQDTFGVLDWFAEMGTNPLVVTMNVLEPMLAFDSACPPLLYHCVCTIPSDARIPVVLVKTQASGGTRLSITLKYQRRAGAGTTQVTQLSVCLAARLGGPGGPIVGVRTPWIRLLTKPRRVLAIGNLKCNDEAEVRAKWPTGKQFMARGPSRVSLFTRQSLAQSTQHQALTVLFSLLKHCFRTIPNNDKIAVIDFGSPAATREFLCRHAEAAGLEGVEFVMTRHVSGHGPRSGFAVAVCTNAHTDNWAPIVFCNHSYFIDRYLNEALCELMLRCKHNKHN